MKNMTFIGKGFLLALSVGLNMITAQYGLAAKAADYTMVPPFLTNQEPPLVMLVMARNHKLYYEAYNDASDLNQDGGLDVGYKGLAEVYTDTNGNNRWDDGETFSDTNGNGQWDIAETFVDANGNGVYDLGETFTDTDYSGDWNPAEPFTDTNGNGVWDAPEPLIDINSDKKWNDAIDYYGYFDSYKCYEYNTTSKRFIPTSAPTIAGKPSKKCTGASEWSGDFLNYLTMSRMDTMRKVLYGGYRSVDTATETVLQRVFIPRDAHSWGKEYESVARDGYNIEDFTPLPLPVAGTRHLFASTTLDANGNYDGADDPPLLRVLPHNTNRIWDWVAKERPVVDNSLENAGGLPATVYTNPIVDHADFENVVATYAVPGHLQGTTDVKRIDKSSGTNRNPFMTNPDDYYISVSTATLRIRDRTGYVNDFDFGIDGDDAVELIIRGVPGLPNNELILGRYGSNGMAGNYNLHAVVNLPNGDYPVEFRHHELTGAEGWALRVKRKKTNSSWNSWEHVDSDLDTITGNYTQANYLVQTDWTQSFYNLVISTAQPSIITDYEVRVEVCKPGLLENNCVQYPNGNYKPTGLLQRYGENDQMMFGLMSGSYKNNTKGGVLRKNVGTIRDEINTNTGVILTPAGGNIIGTINTFRIADFTYNGHQYLNCGWITDRPVNDTGECVAWGNPIGEMMYETIRYFAGKGTATTDFDYSGTTVDSTLGLPKAPWINPYLVEDLNRDGVIGEDLNGNGILDPGEDTNGDGILDLSEDLNNNGKLDGFENCSKPFMLVLSDIYPTYDSNNLPGSIFSSFTGDLSSPAMDVATLADTITAGESFPRNHFIGQEGSAYDGACTEKTVDDLGEVRGLCPEEPTKQGSYYSASVAYYGNQYDVNSTADGNQNVTTYAVALASPLPQIEINVGGKKITLVPFAKSVGGSGWGITQNPPPAGFQPTNTIVDFFVEKITATHGVFRVNFEDVEQGADHDMDAIVRYEYTVNANNTVDVKLDSIYAAGSIIQHMGYIISGTTHDGIYLEVRDEDTGAAADPDYYLDTPPSPACTSQNNPVNCWDDNVALPLTNTRRFSPSNTQAATLMNDPLRYAAKWGGFLDSNTPTEDTNKNGVLDSGEDIFYANNAIDYLSPPKPDLNSEWDEDNDGVPDSYFYVVNPLRLEEQLNKSFAAILRRASAGTAASVISNSRSGEGAIYQSIFFPQQQIGNNLVTWVGEVHALFVDAFGNMREDTNGNAQLNIKNEDLNNNGTLDTALSEDLNGNGVLDAGEDLNGNNRLDLNLNEDLDKDGVLDTRDLIVVFNGTDVYKYDDRNENQKIDTEDEVRFSPDILSWHNNGVLNTEDTNGNGVLDAGEDLNGNGTLDAGEDLNGNGVLDVGEDLNGNGILDTEDLNGNGTLDTERISGPHRLDQVAYIWSAHDWLSGSSIDPVNQRSYTVNDPKRYIFTFVDQDGDMVVDAGEQKPFISSIPVTVPELTDATTLYPYLTLYPNFSDKPAWVSAIDTHGNGDVFRTAQAERLINYIRGQDQGALTIGTAGNTDIIPAMRNRTFYDSTLNANRVWRLGDIVHSSPVVVGRPQEGYHLLYRDLSYARFLARYQARRSVIYVGGNDGMIHAFNGGFFNEEKKSFDLALAEPYTDIDGNNVYTLGIDRYVDLNNNGSWDNALQTQYELGAELWAYVPQNLLPHLYWLTEKNYPHVYYNDMQPKVFDARIFLDAAGNAIDADHPDGWGTVMVVGMRLGGGRITADLNRNDVVDGTDKTMSSALVVFDITNPEAAPKVLAEISLAGMGYTTSFPTVVPMRSKSGTGAAASFNSNDWYLVFGSGPADASGNAAGHNTSTILDQGISLQNGKLFVLELGKLVDQTAAPRVVALNTSGARTTSAPWFIQELESNSYVSQPISVDYNLDFNADTVYFGTISGDDVNGWGGMLRRLMINNERANVAGAVTWTGNNFAGIDRADNVLINAGRPVTAAASSTIGDLARDGGTGARIDINGDGNINLADRERWVYFGTGRFIVRPDADNTDQQIYYGIKEPYDATTKVFDGSAVSNVNLMDVTNAVVWDDRRVTGVTGVTNWNSLVAAQKTMRGWYMDLTDQKERNLGQATLLGDVLTFSTYVPAMDACAFEGESYLYALHYQTGTPFYDAIIGADVIDANTNNIADIGELRSRERINLGRGLALTPNIHTGSEEGSKTFIQTSTGAIETLEQKNPGMSKSGKTSWRQR